MAGKRAQEQARIQALLKRLLKSPQMPFPKAGPLVDVTERQGVYVVRSHHGTVRHVGSTYRVKRGLLQRLRNHLQGQSSFALAPTAAGGLGGHGSKLRQGFTFQVIPVNNGRVRHLLEHLAFGTLCPKYVGTHAKPKQST